jgi:enoyl-CoA hydratase/3-hydroxyacyl-CoA dehydrogenase
LEIKRAAVIGAGIMGHGIAELMAISGIEVNVADSYEEAISRAKNSIQSSLGKMQKSGKLKEDPEAIMARISYTGSLEDAVKNADLVIEAVPEIEKVKRDVIQRAFRASRNDTIIASNTSNILITTLGKDISDPSRLAGFHFFNPPIVMKLVEVIRSEATSDETAETLMNLARKMGKTPILVRRDTPGFVVNRINAPESLLFGLIVQEKMAPPEAVDSFAKAQGLPMGPYELMDYVGIDTMAHSLEYYAEALNPEYGKCHIFHDMMRENRLGAKTGKGFYSWKDGKAEIPKAEASTVIDLMDVLSIEINEAVRLLEQNVAAPSDIETGVKLGMNRPFGPISVAESLTNAEIKNKLLKLSEKFRTDLFKPADSIANGKLKEIISGKQLSSEKKEKRESSTTTTVVSEADPVKLELRDSDYTAVLTIENTRNNLLSLEVLTSLEKNLLSLWNRKETRVIIIRGNGNNLSAGAQLNQFFSSTMDFAENSRRGERIFRMLSEIPKITIAEMKGYTLGGGFELSIWCDLRVITPDCTFGFPEVTLGLIPGWGGSQRLRKLLGASRAMQIILTGERLEGKFALETGLAWKMFPADRIREETDNIARDLAFRVAPISATIAKRLINKGSDVPEDNGLEMEAMSMGLLYGTEDIKEGITAFLQKRKPDYKGR